MKQRGQKRGVALVTVLLLTFVLAVLTTAFLFYAENGYRFSGLQERKNQAYFLALSGLEYYRARPEEFLTGEPQIRYIPQHSKSNYFEVTLDRESGTLECKGVLVSPLSGFSDTDVIERVIMVPNGDLERMYDRSQDL